MDICLPGYTAGKNAYDSIKKIVTPYGKKIVIIGGETALSKAMPYLSEKLSSFEILGTFLYGKEASLTSVDLLKMNPDVLNADVLFAVGGGRAVDTVKCLANELDKPVFTFPTIASNCAAVTKECVMHKDDGSFDKIYYCKPPKHVFIHEKIIMESPFMYFHAGIGDTLSKGYEPLFKSRNQEISYEDSLALSLCGRIKEDIFAYAPKALKYFSDAEETHKLIMHIILTTGYISFLLNPEFNCGIAHSIYYAMTKVYGFEKLNLHGDAVTFGLLVNLIVEKSSDVYRVYDFLKDNGYPVKLIDLKLKVDQLNLISDETMKEPDMLDYPKLVSSHDITRAIILLEEDFLLDKR